MYEYFPHQVAGHDTLFLVDRATLAKPAPPSEVAFYRDAQAHASLCRFLPAFLGTMPLPPESELADVQRERTRRSFLQQQQLPPKPQKDISECVLLENTLQRLRAPCIMDLKLGTRLFGDAASAEKTAVMERARRETTSGTLGVRITGMKVAGTEESDGGGLAGPEHALCSLTEDGRYRGYDKRFGRALTAETFGSVGLRAWLAPLWARREALREVATHLLAAVDGLLHALEGDALPVRLFSASLLLAYDAESGETRCHLIDFARSRFVAPDEPPQDRRDWDGVLWGLRNFGRELRKFCEIGEP